MPFGTFAISCIIYNKNLDQNNESKKKFHIPNLLLGTEMQNHPKIFQMNY